jgi:hypothetical protein
MWDRWCVLRWCSDVDVLSRPGSVQAGADQCVYVSLGLDHGRASYRRAVDHYPLWTYCGPLQGRLPEFGPHRPRRMVAPGWPSAGGGQPTAPAARAPLKYEVFYNEHRPHQRHRQRPTRRAAARTDHQPRPALDRICTVTASADSSANTSTPPDQHGRNLDKHSAKAAAGLQITV